jgi:hypothetical protein
MATSARAARIGNEFWQFNPDARRGAGEYRYNWPAILGRAAQLVRSYGEDAGVTLRQLFYRLVAAEYLPNTQQAYGSLSSQSAEARRGHSKFYRGTFPRLMDRGRDIDRPHLWTDAGDAASWLADRYMEDRASTQPQNLYVVVEKNALRGQLFQWFAPLGLPVIALGGYPSQTLADQVYDDTREPTRRGKPNILIYAGDFDADGQDIMRDFVERASCFDEVEHVALTPEQIEEFALPPQPGKWTSARARGFAEKYEELFRDVYGIDLVQIELDALPPEDLRRVFQERIDGYFDRDAFEEVVAHERREKRKVEMLSEGDGVRIEFARQVLGEMGVEADDDFRDAVAIGREEGEADDDAE